MSFYRPEILSQKNDRNRLFAELNVEFKGWYRGSTDVLHVVDDSNTDKIIKLGQYYSKIGFLPLYSRWMKHHIENEKIMALELSELDSLDVRIPNIFASGTFHCEESRDKYVYLVKEYVSGSSWFRQLGKNPLSKEQKDKLEYSVSKLHEKGFANFDLNPQYRNTNLFLGADDSLWFLDLGSIKKKSKTAFFSKYKERDKMYLTELLSV